MQSRIKKLLTLAMLISPMLCYADASYEKSTQITGGQLVDMLKNYAMISKQMKSLTDPKSEITMVHGNQKAVVSRDSTEITDLDRQVIIRVDNTKKTYSVMTFADMRKMMAEMPQKMAQMQQQMKDAQARAAQQPGQAIPPNLQFNFTTSVTEPGVSKVVNGQNATQQILTMKMTVTDSNNPGTNVAYTLTTEIWTTPDMPPEMKEVQDFDMRFAKALMAGVDLAAFKNMAANSNAAMAQMFGGKPGAAEAFAQMQKELAKIKGTRILEIQRMGGTGTGIAAPPTSGAGGSSTTPPPSGGSAAGQVASDTAKNTAAGESGRLGIPGSALGGALMSAWGRHKAKPAAPAPAPAATTSPAPATQTTVDVTLMEMTTQTNNFSREVIPSSVFEIPSGFKQVPSPMEQMMAR
jgi:hypothetical protein